MMLTLVLLVGAVSCSPVPSEPSLPASVARHGTSPAGVPHVEATHEARQVTFEVIEEVGDATLSTTSSDLSGEDDPPIPTATTPPVLPESEPQEANPAVTEPHHTQRQQQQRESDPYFSHGSPLVIQPQESHNIHLHASLPQSQATPHHDLQNSSSRAASFLHLTSNPEVIQPHDTSSGVTEIDTRPEVIQSHGANPEATLSHEKSSEDTLPHKITEQDSEPGNNKASPQTATSQESSTERSASSQKAPTSRSEHDHSRSSEKHPPHETPVNRDSNESSQQVSDDGTKVQNSKNISEVSHIVPHHHYYPEVEVVVEADLHSWESTEHRHFSASAVRDDTEDAGTGEDLADVGNKGIRNVVNRVDNRTLPLRVAVREPVLVAHSLELIKDKNSDTKDGKVEYIDTGELSTDTEEDTTDEMVAEGLQQGSKIQVSIAEEKVQHPPELAGSDDKPSEESDSKGQTHELSDSLKKEEKSENIDRKITGEVEVVPSLVMDSSSPIDIVERSEEAEKEVLEEAASETVVETAPRGKDLTQSEEMAEEDRRRSRIYMKSSTEDETPDTANVEEQKESENHSGLESMSMTSPTPDTSLEGGAHVSEDPEATVVPPETFSENENTTVTETEDKVEENEESPDPAPSVAPPPTEDYTDNYSDPISSGILPDETVTQEEIPSRERPETDLPLLSTSDKEASDNLRTGAGDVAWALPPQQEQVSAVAPDSLTPGCIVAIVFGVIISVTVLSGIAGFVVWQRRTLNRPKVLGSDRGYAGSDSGGYIDDQVRVSYVNSQIDSPKGSPEDLISLDNDSFLNSLESMTIQNLWTDNIRHTKL